MYGAETWAAKKAQEKKLDVAEVWGEFIRHIFNNKPVVHVCRE